MRSGAMPYWVTDGRRFSRAAAVLLDDVEKFLSIDITPENFGSIPIAKEMTQIDAIDVLNVDPLQIGRVIQAGELSFKPEGVSLMTPRREVIELAAKTISAGEIALRLRMDFRAVPRMMATKHPEVSRCAVGWIRADFNSAFGV